MFQQRKSKERTAAGGQKLFRATPSARGKHFSRDKEGAPFIGGRQKSATEIRRSSPEAVSKVQCRQSEVKKVMFQQQGKDRRRRAKVVSRNRFRARKTLQPTPTDELQSDGEGALLRNSSPPAVGATVIHRVPARIPRIPRFGTPPRPGHVTNFHENT